VLGQGTAGYRTSIPRPGWAEADPEDWWQATCTAVRAAAGPAPAEVGALAVAGQMHGVLLCTERAVVLRPAITWLDRRAEAEAADYRRLPGQMLARLGNAPSPGMAGPILLWLSRHEPGAYRRARWMLQPKDWLRHRLTGMGPTGMGPTGMGPTGKAATDPTDASGTLLFDQASSEWATDVAEALGLRTDFLPAIRPPAEIAGPLLPAAAEQLGLRPTVPALPVATGAADTAASLLAAHLLPRPPGLPPGPMGLLTLGTGGQLIVPGPAAASPNQDIPFSDNPDPGELAGPGGTINLFRAVDGGTYRLAAAQNVGVTLDWVRRTLGASWDELYGTAARPWRADTPVFLPYLAGERWDHRASGGAWTGLTLDHERADLLRAALEGVAFLLRTKLDDLRAHRAASPAAIQLAGGGSRHPAWRRLLADALGVPLYPVYPGGEGWLTARGAALIAAAAIGLVADASTTARSVLNSEAVLPASHLAEPGYQRFKSAGSQQNTLSGCIVLCRERGAGLVGQAQARGVRPDGGDELPGGHRRGRGSAGRRRAGHRPHGGDGWRPPGRGSRARGDGERSAEPDLAAARGALTVARPLADAEFHAIRARASRVPAVHARADHT
jgi:xylulokinase